MIPPFIRRCPECGYVGWSGRFRVVNAEANPNTVVCPSCSHRFETIDNPWLN